MNVGLFVEFVRKKKIREYETKVFSGYEGYGECLQGVGEPLLGCGCGCVSGMCFFG